MLLVLLVFINGINNTYARRSS